MRHVGMYVDGYNFYYAIKQKYHINRIDSGQGSLIGLGWCDFRRLGEHMIDPNSEQIKKIKYFTARVEQEQSGFAGERQRQKAWLDAVSTVDGLRVITGRLMPRGNSQGNDRKKPNRKEQYTDTNITVEILLDALDLKGYDKAILITGDTDQAPTVYAVQKGMVDRGLIPNGKKVDVWVPPGGPTNGWSAYFREPEHFCPIQIETITESSWRRVFCRTRGISAPVPGVYLRPI